VLYAATLEIEADPRQLRHSEQFPGAYLCSFAHDVVVETRPSPPSSTALADGSPDRVAAAASR